MDSLAANPRSRPSPSFCLLLIVLERSDGAKWVQIVFLPKHSSPVDVRLLLFWTSGAISLCCLYSVWSWAALRFSVTASDGGLRASELSSGNRWTKTDLRLSAWNLATVLGRSGWDVTSETLLLGCRVSCPSANSTDPPFWLVLS